MRTLGLTLFLVAAGCSGSLPNGQLVDPGPAPTNGLQIVLPVIKDVLPGTDNELCTWTNVTPDKDLFVKAVQAFQTVAGHHVVLYKTKSYQPAGTTRKCTDDDLTTVRFVAGAGGEGQAMKNEAPGNLVYTVEAGYQIILNHHYINATPTKRDVQSAVNLYFAEAGSSFVPSGALAVVDTNLDLPPGQPTKDIHCTMQNDLKLWYAIPHMHAYGLDITVDHVPVGGASERLFDTPWTPEYTFHPPQKNFDPATPMLLSKGDQVNVHCVWNNDTAQPLTFGIEMCVFFAATVDTTGTGNLACDAGQWTGF